MYRNYESRRRKMKKLILLITIFGLLAVPALATEWESDLIYYDANDMLVYDAEPDTGHRIGDFSYAGYMGGGVNLPDVNTVKTISPVAGYDTNNIQSAIDEVCAMTPDANGIRGALLLEAGTYDVNASLYVNASGVVIRGEGDGGGGDTIIYRVKDYDTEDAGDWDDPAYREGVLTFIGEGADTKFNHYESDTTSNIIDDYVPVGARVVHVNDPNLYEVGDRIVITHPDTWDWLEAVDYGGCSWDPGDVHIVAGRYIVAKNGNAICFDAPLFFDIDKSLTQATMNVFDDKDRLTNVGVEDLRVDMETDGSTSDEHAHFAVVFRGVDDSWALRSTGRHFQRSGFHMNGVSRMTIRECEAIDPHSVVTGGRRYNFYHLNGQQILVEDCYANHARHAYICVGSGRDNCNVYLNNTGYDDYYSSEGHYRWVNGLLFDNHYEDSDDWNHIGFQRMGCEHGWATVHSVAWNCTVLNGGNIVIQEPPTAQNYAIGCFADVSGDGPWQNGPDGWIEGTDTADLSPSSLYEAQLAERLANPNDTTAPAAPSNLVATPDNGQVSLDWDDNTEFDLAGYNVYRDDSSGGPYSKINGSLLLSSSYTDTSVTNDNTYYYVVTAEDVFSNESDNSSEVSATPRVPEPNESTFYAIEDTYANKYDENTNYGSDDDVQTHEVGKWTFLKFTVSDICGGVNEATLRVYCFSNNSDTVNVKEVSDNNWDEDTMTWVNKPDIGSELDDQTVSSIGWVEFDVTSYITANGTYSFGMDQDATDKNKFYSKDYDSGSYAPELVVSYGPTPPNAPTNLGATGGDGQVVLDWDDNTEENLDGYNVYRDDSSGGPYTKINGSLVADSNYVDDTVTNGNTYYYVVTAVDTNSVESDGSNEASATPSGGGEETFYPTDDTYANKNNRDTNYGSDTDVQTHNNAKWSFLQFTVSDIAGDVNEATLRVYCFDNNSDTVNVKEVSDNNWDEDSLTWNDKPDLDSEIDDQVVSSTGWVEFDVSSYIDGNGTFSFGMDQDGSDKNKFYSKEYDSGSHSPELIVTY